MAKWWRSNYAGELQGNGINGNVGATFLNYWQLFANGGWRGRTLDDRLTRGGPSASTPGGGFWNGNGSTDAPRRSRGRNVDYGWSESGSWNRNANLSSDVKPSSLVKISADLSWSRSRNAAQYVRTVVDPRATATYGSRYVFGELDQWQLTLTTRVSVLMTPRVSLQVFMQPLLAAGNYTGFMELARPRTFDFLRYADPVRSVGGFRALLKRRDEAHQLRRAANAVRAHYRASRRSRSRAEFQAELGTVREARTLSA